MTRRGLPDVTEVGEALARQHRGARPPCATSFRREGEAPVPTCGAIAWDEQEASEQPSGSRPLLSGNAVVGPRRASALAPRPERACGAVGRVLSLVHKRRSETGRRARSLRTPVAPAAAGWLGRGFGVDRRWRALRMTCSPCERAFQRGVTPSQTRGGRVCGERPSIKRMRRSIGGSAVWRNSLADLAFRWVHPDRE